MTRWLVPGVAVLIGVVYLVAGLMGGDVRFGVAGLCLMVAVGAAFWLLSGRSETFAALRDRNDERINAIDQCATTFAGMVLIGTVLVMFVVEIARGQDGAPYFALGAVAGVAYVTAMVFLRFRR